MNISSEEIIVFSDLHLDESFPKITKAFLEFTDQLINTHKSDRTVFILGDLFESWIGDDTLETLTLDSKTWLDTIFNALHTLAQKYPTYFIHGNRDFLIGQEFERFTGIQCLAEVSQVEFHGLNITLCHGDHLCTQDTDYMKFRAMVRQPQWQAVFLEKSKAERIAIADSLRTQSKNANTIKVDAILDVNPEAVSTLTQTTDLLIHGHTHRPCIHTDKTSKAPRIVLGDWAPDPSWLALKKTQAGIQATLHARDWMQSLAVK